MEPRSVHIVLHPATIVVCVEDEEGMEITHHDFHPFLSGDGQMEAGEGREALSWADGWLTRCQNAQEFASGRTMLKVEQSKE